MRQNAAICPALSVKNRKASAFISRYDTGVFYSRWISYFSGRVDCRSCTLEFTKYTFGRGIHLFGFAILFFRNEKAETKSRYYLGHPLYSGFILIFVAEWSDKTQIAAGLFATRYNSLMVLIGVLIVLSLLSIIAIYLGKFISDKVTRETLTKLTGFLFISMGVLFFLV
jgi:putative Ca2+/H+ antiporter (TMEM165/GDT1 family)